MFLTVSQYILISAFSLAAALFLVLIAGFQVWKKLITVPGKGGFGYHYKSKAHEQAYDRTAAVAMKIVNPVALLWVAGVSLGSWVIIRVVLSFI